LKIKHTDIIKKIIKAIFCIGTICLAIFLVLKTAHAADSYLGTEWDKYLQGNLKNFAGADSKTGEALAINLIRNLIRIARYIIGAVALVFGILFGMELVLSRGKEETITKQKTNFLWTLLGFIILIVSENVANIFNPESATTQRLIDFGAARDQLRDGVNYIKWLFGSVVVLFMSISAIRMITAGGDEEMITKQKRNLTWSMIGMLVILLANNLVNAFYIINEPKEVVPASATVAITEIASVIKLILVFLGPLAIIFTIYAGFLYLTAMDNEDRSGKAKRMIVGGVTGIVIIYSAYALINTVTAGKFAALPFTLLT
jgi:hypothetical protein